MAEKFECGRSEMCGPCLGLDRKAGALVCKSVAFLMRQHRPETFGDTSALKLASIHMEQWVDGEDVVTWAMEDAALESFKELIDSKQGVSNG